MKIAVEGCAHGELDDIYDTIKALEEERGIKIDLLLCCGDFQSTRNAEDLRCMAVPAKYASMCSFYKYYSGEKEAPYLTIFIGGNHEASNYLQELPYGGWVAPNIYYLGYAGVVNVNGIRIGGISGIYKPMDYFKGRFETSPYNRMTIRSVYHVRNIDIFRLKQLSGEIDVIMSHDWPANITKYGNKQQLIRFKPYFADDIESGKLGNPFTEQLLHKLKPHYWFSGHLHCKFAALIEHDDKTTTKFLALDKCLPKRRFLQIIDITTLSDSSDSSSTSQTDGSSSNQPTLEYDLEWLTILHRTNHLITTQNANCYMPNEHFTPNDAEKQHVLSIMGNSLVIPRNFVKTGAIYDPALTDNRPHKTYLNPQTLLLCAKLRIDDPIQMVNIAEIDLDSSVTFAPSEVSVSTPVKRMAGRLSLPKPKNDCYERGSDDKDGKSDDKDDKSDDKDGKSDDKDGKSDDEDGKLTGDSSAVLKRASTRLELLETRDGVCDDESGVGNDEKVFFFDVGGNTSIDVSRSKFKRRNIDMYRDD